jgi:ATPase subunit of ABC transporter with duplicated ATPase domains
MADISIHELNKYYGSNHVLKGISFEIHSGERVGMLGRNGSGKTTLFKCITGEEHYESGNVAKASGKSVEMLAQIPDFGDDVLVDDVLRSSFKEITDVYIEMKRIEGDATPSVLKKYGRLMDEYERLGGYETDVRLEKICNGMKISDELRYSAFGTLSGGEKTRVNLSRILLCDCDILLLDEPTNHLDLVSLNWLESFLRDFNGTVVVVSHDRVFLDNVVTRIIEVDDGKANMYSGNYSFYIEEKERRFLTQAELHKQQQRKIHQLETAIHRQRVWAAINPANTGLAKRALAMEKRIEQMDKVEKPTKVRKLTGEFNDGAYAAKELVELTSVTKCYDSRVIFDDVNLKVRRGDSIALIGANGSGKTTLIKLMLGQEQSDEGFIKVSINAKVAYMPQIIEFDDGEATVLETLRYQDGITEERARMILSRFHFYAKDVLKKVNMLSGGEKSRLKLCLLMQNNVNFLILDEPTNHLDIESREWIEDAIADFEGTKLFISHDRYFLDKFAERVWEVVDGRVEERY